MLPSQSKANQHRDLAAVHSSVRRRRSVAATASVARTGTSASSKVHAMPQRPSTAAVIAAVLSVPTLRLRVIAPGMHAAKMANALVSIRAAASGATADLVAEQALAGTPLDP